MIFADMFEVGGGNPLSFLETTICFEFRALSCEK